MPYRLAYGSGRILLPLAAALAAALPSAAGVTAQESITLPTRDVALRDRPTDVFTVGTVEGQDWEMFSGIRSVVFDRSDNMYLLDGQNTRVLVFDARGRFVRQFGRKGGGPGELQSPMSMALLADGNLAVNDMANRAFVIYTPAGEHVANVGWADGFGFPIGELQADAQGGLVMRVMQPSQSNQPESGFSPIVRVPVGPLRAGVTGEIATAGMRPLYRVPIEAPRVTDAGSSSTIRRTTFLHVDPVFGPRPTYGTLPGGTLAVHHETDYIVRIVDANGRVTRTITRGLKPKKVTKKDQEQWESTRSSQARGGAGNTTIVLSNPSASAGGAAPAMPASIATGSAQFAEFMSVVTGIRTDPQGRVWVQRRKADGGAQGPIDLITADGRYIGTLPEQRLPRAVSGSGLAAWVITDDLGVERVAVRRLPQSWR